MTMTFNDPRLGASLDNPSLADRVINLSKELSEANDKIGLLTLAKNDMDQALERSATWQKMYSRVTDQIDNVATIIKDAIIADDIDIDTLKGIAQELNIELTREVRVNIKINASGTVTVPIEFDLDEIDTEISVEFSNNYGDLELDIDVDEMTVDCEDRSVYLS
jgi:hypothetical protein